MLTDFMQQEGREKESERNIDMMEKHQLVVSHSPQLGSDEPTTMCPAQELNLQPFGLWDHAPTN